MRRGGAGRVRKTRLSEGDSSGTSRVASMVINLVLGEVGRLTHAKLLPPPDILKALDIEVVFCLSPVSVCQGMAYLLLPMSVALLAALARRGAVEDEGVVVVGEIDEQGCCLPYRSAARMDIAVLDGLPSVTSVMMPTGAVRHLQQAIDAQGSGMNNMKRRFGSGTGSLRGVASVGEAVRALFGE